MSTEKPPIIEVEILPSQQNIQLDINDNKNSTIQMELSEKSEEPIGIIIDSPILKKYSVSADHLKSNVNNPSDDKEEWIFIGGGAEI